MSECEKKSENMKHTKRKEIVLQGLRIRDLFLIFLPNMPRIWSSSVLVIG